MAEKKKRDWKKTLEKIKKGAKEGYSKLDKGVAKARKNMEEKDEEYSGGLGLFR